MELSSKLSNSSQIFSVFGIHLIHAITSRSSAQDEGSIGNPENQSVLESQEQNSLPPNYATCSVKVIYKAMLILTRPGYEGVMKIREEKEKHLWSLQILDELLECASMYDYENPRETPYSHHESEHMDFKTIEDS